MFITSTLPVVAAALALALPTTAAPQPLTGRAESDLSLQAQLRLAETTTERYDLIPNDEDFVFDFSTSDSPVATSQNWPALIAADARASFSIGQLEACSMAFLHLHPRATELFSLSAGRILSHMVPQAGVLDSEDMQRVISVELTPGKVTVYPAGSFHTQVNPDCEPANFTAAFNSEEFAAGIVAPQVFSLPDDVISRTFGQSIAGEEIEKVRDAIPKEIAIKVDECLAKCGKEKR
ncbi:germin family protein [Aspergillus lucknowensis]|uniref:RmlC-like cupin domain-containing protein n=1 Tax=Aspergillus lucknowensis TaxID=176173 RepID=A0ABR4LX40_9EURO